MGDLIQVNLEVEGLGLMITAYLPREVLFMLLRGLNREDKPLELPFSILVGLGEYQEMNKETPERPSFDKATWLAESVHQAADLLRDIAKKRGVNSFLIEEIEEEGHSDEGSRIRVSNYLGLLEIPPGTIRWPEESPSHSHTARP